MYKYIYNYAFVKTYPGKGKLCSLILRTRQAESERLTLLILGELLLEDVPLHGELGVLEVGLVQVGLQHGVLLLQESGPDENKLSDRRMVM